MIPRTLSWILHANYKPVLSAVNELYFRFANNSEKEHAPMRGAGSALFQDTLQGCDADRFAGATGRSSESPEDRPAPERTGRCGLCGRARLPQRPTMMPAPALFADAVRSRRGNEGRPGSGTDARGPEGSIHSAAPGDDAQFSGAGRYHALICGRVGNVQTVPTSRADVEHASAPSLGFSAAPPPVAVGRHARL
jgi:hypothetical protein